MTTVVVHEFSFQNILLIVEEKHYFDVGFKRFHKMFKSTYYALRLCFWLLRFYQTIYNYHVIF